MIGSFVYPGDIVTSVIVANGPDYSLGPGLRERGTDHSIIVTLAGTLRFDTVFYVQSLSNRYRPRKGDTIVGVVNDRTSETYKVDINSCSPSSMLKIAFDGATKRNAPNLSNGACILARVEETFLEDTTITCISTAESTNKKSWTTGQSAFGELTRANIDQTNVCFSLTISQTLVERLSSQISSSSSVSRDHPSILGVFGNAFKFEIAVGSNGIIWVSCESLQHALMIRSVLNIAETQNDLTCWLFAEKLLDMRHL